MAANKNQILRTFTIRTALLSAIICASVALVIFFGHLLWNVVHTRQGVVALVVLSLLIGAWSAYDGVMEDLRRGRVPRGV